IKDFKETPAPNIKPSRKLPPVLDDLKARYRRVSGSANRTKPEIWYRLSRTEEILNLEELKPDRIILPLTRPNLKRINQIKRRHDRVLNRLIWALPPLLFGSELDDLNQDLKNLRQVNLAGFMISNLSHIDILNQSSVKRPGRRLSIYADYRLNCLNTEAEAQLKSLRLDGVTLSIENDEKNLRQILSQTGPITRLLYIYGRPSLFTSRFVPPGLKDN
ncbi:MAG: hypothetical protein JRG97_07280, partial [Deltaproteobacteria bacterium]|nr:hypothetical protein [Deltaproteobacteria bacterium]